MVVSDFMQFLTSFGFSVGDDLSYYRVLDEAVLCT